uniref:Sigma NS n=1 Tax=Phocid orthoreovirus 1 TaxID=2854225 RepID=A0A7L5ES34_9REOV|nr:Sigma NS [Phocid orthoreovirus 1]
MAAALRSAITQVKKDDNGQIVCGSYNLLRASVLATVNKGIVSYNVKFPGFFPTMNMLKPLKYAARERLLGQKDLSKIASRDALQTRDCISLCRPTPDCAMIEHHAATLRELVANTFELSHEDALTYVPMDNRFSPSSLSRLFTMGMAGLFVAPNASYRRVPIHHLAADLNDMSLAMPYMIAVEDDAVKAAVPTVPVFKLLEDNFSGLAGLEISYGCEVNAGRQSAAEQSNASSRSINELFDDETGASIATIKTCLILNCEQLKAELTDLANNGPELDKIQMMISFTEKLFRMCVCFAPIDSHLLCFCLKLKERGIKIPPRDALRLWDDVTYGRETCDLSEGVVSVEKGKWTLTVGEEVLLSVFPVRV